MLEKAGRKSISGVRSQLSSICFSGMEKTKSAVETSKNIAVQGGTFGIGAAVVATQVRMRASAFIPPIALSPKNCSFSPRRNAFNQ